MIFHICLNTSIWLQRTHDAFWDLERSKASIFVFKDSVTELFEMLCFAWTLSSLSCTIKVKKLGFKWLK